MTVEDLNAPTGEQPTLPAETIATEMPSRVPDEPAPQPVPEAEEPEAAAPEEPADEPEGQPEKPDGQQPKPEKLDWREKRRIEETNKRRAAEAENARLKAEIEAIRNGGTPPASPDQASAQTPEQIRAAAVEEARRQLAAEQQAKEFAEATGRVLQAGLAAHSDFDQARVEMVNNFGDQLAQRNDFFEAIVNLENGHDVFYALARDPEQAEQVLSMPPVKMAVKLAQLSTTLGSKAPEQKPISKAPAPVKPVAGVPQSSSRLDDEGVPMDQWASTYLKQMAGKR